MPETSIIIVSHNGLLQNTGPCLESIFRNGARSDFEVIVVDNDSSDETPAYLENMMEREPRLRCVFNKSNRGFAGGNNDGLKIASGSFLILLNSDCIVTKNWIEGLTALPSTRSGHRTGRTGFQLGGKRAEDFHQGGHTRRDHRRGDRLGFKQPGRKIRN